MKNYPPDSKKRNTIRALRTMLTILLTLILASVSALSVFGAAAADSSENEEEIKDKATSAFQEFLDGKRSMVFHNGSERTEFHYLDGEDTFADGEEYTAGDLIDKVRDAAEKVTDGSDQDEEPVGINFIKYAVIDGASLPFLTMCFEIRQPVIGTNEAYFVMHYVPEEDKIHLTLAQDSWPKSSLRFNRNGIVTDTVSVSAYETSYVYRQITGSGDVNFIYSSYYDNRKVSISDLNEREKNIYLASYRVPGGTEDQSGPEKEDTYYTLHRAAGGDPTFLIDPTIDLTAGNPAAALYMEELEELEEGAQLVNHSTVISAVLQSMDRLGVSPGAFFADEPEWTDYESK